MTRIKWALIGVLIVLFGCDHHQPGIMQASFVMKPQPRVEALLAKMTLEEKVGQMAQVTLDVVTQGPNAYESDEPLKLNIDLVREAILTHKVGSILNTANNRARPLEKWHEVIGQIQQVAVRESRLGIPVIYGIDAIHGATYTSEATFFPQQIGLAATWNRDLVRKCAAIAAYETRASAIPWNFSPVLDLGRDPRFPRMWETFGEDVMLASEMGVQMVKGYQGEDVSAPGQVAATLKHFLGYSVPASGKDRTPVHISEVELRERHLPAFKAAVDAGAKSVMINSGLINGTPVHANKALLTDLLKKELGFTGVVVTDWKDIDNLHFRDRVAATRKEAVKIAVNAGIDMAMIPYDFDFCKDLVALVREGEVPMSRIDDAVTRILTLKYDLGLFDQPTPRGDYEDFGSEETVATARKAAGESITLLKNQGLLPLSRGVKVLVTGPNAHTMRALNGGWSYSWQGEKVEEFANEYQTILEAIKAQAGEELVTFEPGVTYVESGKYWEEEAADFRAVLDAASNSDVVVLCLGENSYTEKPGDLHDLSLSQNQVRLTRALATTGKPIVLVLNEGRPRLISEIEPDVDAVVQTYLPGNYGGEALAQVLFGELNPSGKLPYTYPMFANTLVTYDHKPSEEQDKMEGVYDYESDFAVQYPFGHGLSYTSFAYKDLTLSDDQLDTDEELTVSVTVTNVGDRAGKEVVQLFIADAYASLSPDVKRLRGFEKISLEPGQSKTVRFSIHARQLAFVGKDLRWTVEKGTYEVQISNLKKQFELSDSYKWQEVDPVL
ncbi:glycoside hydrolase family 3 N-terminal domain-containing protein [Marinoscillum furvescens]|uniref:beta-glucosidase n=1 Tax=Marinoscillum furvescens DSM 4134 TaxID=1122208 RepID=A0A3D9L6M0_MARFU|nr:glycoside hydrolase family 3 N-terminal domain-containing protein [Marinoscillum furvescens]RED99818.1 beta-glucosidase [Marinoscillum furvescens DSM 4134]